VGGSTLTRNFVGWRRGKQPAAMIAAESDEMTLPALVKTQQSPWHEDNLVLLTGPKSVRCEHPHSSQNRAWVGHPSTVHRSADDLLRSGWQNWEDMNFPARAKPRL